MGLLPSKIIGSFLILGIILGYAYYQKTEKERFEVENALLKANIASLEQALIQTQAVQSSSTEYSEYVENELLLAQQTINSLLENRHDSTPAQRSIKNEQKKLFHILNAPL